MPNARPERLLGQNNVGMETVHPYDADEARRLIAERAHAPGAMLPILHALQTHFGAVPKQTYGLIAEALNVSKADVVGVVTFYHDFREQPFEGRTLKLCRAEACQAAGCEELVAYLAHRHRLVPDEDREGLRIETVYCLGNCALSPAAMLDDQPIGRLDAEKLDAVVAATTP
jgi:formate dehydrogenase subunit gamma